MNCHTPTLPTEPTLFPLTRMAITRVSGQDRASYLQGQLTCDVNRLSLGQDTLAGHCDLKGKLWSNLRLLSLEDELLLLTSHSVLPRQLPELKKFAVFAKVEISPDPRHAIGIAGEGSDEWIKEQFSLCQSGLILGGIAVFIEKNRWILITTEQPTIALPIGDESLWWGLDIKAGLPHMEAIHQGEFIPQMLNLQALGGISFTKGCYMGQEVVARAKYRGANNRALFILKGHIIGELTAGDTLEIQLGENWRRSGTIINSWQHEDTVWLSAVLPKDTNISASFRFKERDSALTIEPLPYSSTE